MEMETTDTPCVLLLNLSAAALAGIDLLSFTTTPRFKGIKNLPPGYHFIFTSSTSSLSVRHGAWLHVKSTKANEPAPLFIKKWNPSTEALEAETAPAELLHWRANLGSIWREGLSPYRQSAAQDPGATEEKNDWDRLTSEISESLLSAITGPTIDHWTLTSASSAKVDEEKIPGLTQTATEILEEKELTFVPIDLKRTWRPGATGRERTEAVLDHTWALNDLIENHCRDKVALEILGEMQFCFLMVLSLNNYSCLEQWKRILNLLLTCKSAVVQHPSLYVKLLSTLRLQLQHCNDVEGGLFDLSDESGSLLKALLHKFKLGLTELPKDSTKTVTEELFELENYLRGEHGWRLDSDFVRKGMMEMEDGEKIELQVSGYEEEDESGEYAPVVVDLSPEDVAAFAGATPFRKITIQDRERKEVEDSDDESDASEGREDYEVELEDDAEVEEMDMRY
ncbi:AAR2 domain-containing protein [Venturia nashicola]|uniref:AAR2 domain-containing protein n=1 Tax=Venturia nashicola TaxID=86259 RepID=A0A4Z1PPN9_9PEZI|nr:AAR2 domain-containing protein [Venturia nashicola]